MTTVQIAQNVHVRDQKGKKIANEHVTGTFSYEFPDTVEEYGELTGSNEEWPTDSLVRLANEALKRQLQARIHQGLQKALFHQTKNARVEASEEDLVSIQETVTNYAPFQRKRAAQKTESSRALKKNFEEKGDAASALAMFNGQLQFFRDAVRADPSKATDPHLVEIYAGLDPTLVSFGLRPLTEELLEIAKEVSA